MTNDLNIEGLKTKIQDLHNAGITADDIIHQLSLPYDIKNTVSPVNQDILRQRAEAGASEDVLVEEAALIAQLRQWKQDEALHSVLNPELWNQYTTLKAEYIQITTKDIITEADRKRLKEILVEIDEIT